MKIRNWSHWDEDQVAAMFSDVVKMIADHLAIRTHSVALTVLDAEGVVHTFVTSRDRDFDFVPLMRGASEMRAKMAQKEN